MGEIKTDLKVQSGNEAMERAVFRNSVTSPSPTRLAAKAEPA